MVAPSRAGGSARRTSAAGDVLTCSVRLLIPFARLLRSYPGFPVELLQPLEAFDLDDRLPVASTFELLEGAVALTSDPDLGLKAGRATSLSDYGEIEYLARSAPTLGDAIEVVGRYLRLLNDALEFALAVEGERALLRLQSRVPLSRAAADFQAAAFFTHASELLGVADVDVEVWLSHPRPEQVEEHARTFGPCRVRFEAPFDGFVLPARDLARPHVTADQPLHAVLRKHAEQLLEELSAGGSVSARVRSLIVTQVEGGHPTVVAVAAALELSPRTLARALAREGTSFTALLDDVRRGLALRYVGERDLGLSEVAFLLGFSASGGFHRAFRRWTGQSPLEYRRARRG